MHDFPDLPVKKTSRPFICRAASTDLAACSSSTSSALRSLPAKGSAWHWHAISSKPQKSTDFGWVKRHTALAPGSGRVSEVLRPNLEALLFMLFLADLEPWLIQGQKKEKTWNNQNSQYHICGGIHRKNAQQKHQQLSRKLSSVPRSSAMVAIGVTVVAPGDPIDPDPLSDSEDATCMLRTLERGRVPKRLPDWASRESLPTSTDWHVLIKVLIKTLIHRLRSRARNWNGWPDAV